MKIRLMGMFWGLHDEQGCKMRSKYKETSFSSEWEREARDKKEEEGNAFSSNIPEYYVVICDLAALF